MADAGPLSNMAGLDGLRRRKENALARIRALVDPVRDAQTLFVDDKGELKPAARRLINRLAREAKMHAIAFEPDARLQDYRLGQQSIVHLLMTLMEIDHAKLIKLQRELGE